MNVFIVTATYQESVNLSSILILHLGSFGWFLSILLVDCGAIRCDNSALVLQSYVWVIQVLFDFRYTYPRCGALPSYSLNLPLKESYKRVCLDFTIMLSQAYCFP